jgi:hypothetical protein
VSVLRYADDLKLFMTIKCIGDCQLFDLNVGKYKSISFHRKMRLIEFVYSNNRTAFKRVNEMKDLGVIMD